jgi:hypothetical protein
VKSIPSTECFLDTKRLLQFTNIVDCHRRSEKPVNARVLEDIKGGRPRGLEKYVGEAPPEIQTSYWAAQAAAQSGKVRCTGAALGMAQRETGVAAIAISGLASVAASCSKIQGARF